MLFHAATGNCKSWGKFSPSLRDSSRPCTSVSGFHKKTSRQVSSFGKYCRTVWLFFFPRDRNYTDGMNPRIPQALRNLSFHWPVFLPNLMIRVTIYLSRGQVRRIHFKSLLGLDFFFFWHGVETFSESTWTSNYHPERIAISTHSEIQFSLQFIIIKIKNRCSFKGKHSTEGTNQLLFIFSFNKGQGNMQLNFSVKLTNIWLGGW